jgi:hypothetical protein
MLSSADKVHPNLAGAPVTGVKLLAWTIVAAVLVVIAIYTAAVSGPPDVDSLGPTGP